MKLIFNRHPVYANDLLYRCFPQNSKCFATLRTDGVLEISLKEPTLTYTQKIEYARNYLSAHKDIRVFSYYHNVVTCYVPKRSRTLCGHAACNPSDKYHDDIGRAIAFARAIGEDPEKISPLLR